MSKRSTDKKRPSSTRKRAPISGRPRGTPRELDFRITYEGKLPESKILKSIETVRLEIGERFGDSADWRNLLIHGDNLPVLKSLLTDAKLGGKIRLVYIDPPYSTRQAFSTRQNQHAYHDELAGAHYLEFLRRRLILLRELLAEDGSIYVHLDDNMAYPVKVLMDEIFGPRNFRNWITRQKCSFKNYTRKQFGNIQDFMLFYTKSDHWVWNRPFEQRGLVYSLEERFPHVEKSTGRRYALVPLHARGIRNGETGKPWRGLLPPAGKHWQYLPSKLEEMDRRREIYWSPSGNPRRKIYADENPGVPVQDIWLGFKDEKNQMVQVTGYPTEKNADLLRRIISTSSNVDDIVLDCFCGSGTTLYVAEELGRRWIGVDSSAVAIDIAKKRLRAYWDQLFKGRRTSQELLFEVPIAGFDGRRFHPWAVAEARTKSTEKRREVMPSRVAAPSAPRSSRRSRVHQAS